MRHQCVKTDVKCQCRCRQGHVARSRARDVMSVALVLTLLVATLAVSSGSRDVSRDVSRDRSGAPVSPKVVCLTRKRVYGGHFRHLNAAFFNPLRDLNRNSSFAFRPATTLTHRIVELSEFSPPEVRLSLLIITVYFAARSHVAVAY